MSARPTDAAAVVDDLAAALRAALALCDNPDAGGYNLPELLRAALEDVAREQGGADELTRHRPGSWEADHVRSLAAGADWLDR